MFASMKGHIECVTVLLDKDAKINMQDRVSGVVIHFVHVTRVPRCDSRHMHKNPIVCIHVHAMLLNN